MNTFKTEEMAPWAKSTGFVHMGDLGSLPGTARSLEDQAGVALEYCQECSSYSQKPTLPPSSILAQIQHM